MLTWGDLEPFPLVEDINGHQMEEWLMLRMFIQPTLSIKNGLTTLQQKLSTAFVAKQFLSTIFWIIFYDHKKYEDELICLKIYCSWLKVDQNSFISNCPE